MLCCAAQSHAVLQSRRLFLPNYFKLSTTQPGVSPPDRHAEARNLRHDLCPTLLLFAACLCLDHELTRFRTVSIEVSF